MTYLSKFSSLLAVIVLILVGCGKNSEPILEGKESIPPPRENPRPSPLIDTAPTICSTLDFDDVRWPSDYTMMDQMAFSLAINITGSFEGHSGWTNLSNNFDGQGFSMGILNQNLGQGTIQPLFIEMRNSHMDVLEDAMSESMLESLLTMLEKWESANPTPRPLLQPNNIESDRELVLNEDSENIDKKYAYRGLQTFSNSASVRWAKKTLYSDSKGRNFKPAWKTALKQIAGDPAYVSLQVSAAKALHLQALQSRDRLGWTEIRGYLLLFDFVVQNGGLKDKHFKKFERWFARNPQATEKRQMEEVLEIRVVDSHPKWQKDVRSRKSAIIKGLGFVHGENRDLQAEYCYDQTLIY